METITPIREILPPTPVLTSGENRLYISLTEFFFVLLLTFLSPSTLNLLKGGRLQSISIKLNEGNISVRLRDIISLFFSTMNLMETG